MNKEIKVCYRKIIDKSATKQWEQLLWEDTFLEFKMQAQRFNIESKKTLFSEMLQANAAAEQLHFLVSSAAIGYIKQLNDKVPDVLNVLGKHFMPFKHFKFEIINSDITDNTKHKVAVNFFSEPMLWVETVGDKLVVALNSAADNEELLTETFVLQPFLSIYSIK